MPTQGARRRHKHPPRWFNERMVGKAAIDRAKTAPILRWEDAVPEPHGNLARNLNKRNKVHNFGT